MTSEPFGCVGNTFPTRSGVWFDLANPKAADVNFGDIAGALAKECRFGKQLPRHYSVAEHLFHCAAEAALRGMSNSAQVAIFMHDATEAYCGDVIKPLKIMLSEYAAIESKIESAIAERFGIDFESYQDEIIEIDRAMLIAERRAMRPNDGVVWAGQEDVKRLYVNFHYWDWTKAEQNFVMIGELLGLDIGNAKQFLTFQIRD